jgi:hypothetical protein
MRKFQLDHYEEKADRFGCRALWLAVIHRAFCDACWKSASMRTASGASVVPGTRIPVQTMIDDADDGVR